MFLHPFESLPPFFTGRRRQHVLEMTQLLVQGRLDDLMNGKLSAADVVQQAALLVDAVEGDQERYDREQDEKSRAAREQETRDEDARRLEIPAAAPAQPAPKPSKPKKPKK